MNKRQKKKLQFKRIPGLRPMNAKNWRKWLEKEEIKPIRLTGTIIKARRLLKQAGCKCKPPLIGERPGVGPRCKLCGTVATAPEWTLYK